MRLYLTNFYRENKRWFRITIQWFFIAAFFGMLTYLFDPALILRVISAYTGKFGAHPALGIHLARQIFAQNLSVAAISLFGGIILGLAPFIIIGINGFILGYV